MIPRLQSLGVSSENLEAIITSAENMMPSQQKADSASVLLPSDEIVPIAGSSITYLPNIRSTSHNNISEVSLAPTETVVVETIKVRFLGFIIMISLELMNRMH